MVHSNGTRLDSQRLRIDFTGRKKYSGLLSDLRRVSAGGEEAARRAMPTSGAFASGDIPAAALDGRWAGPEGGGPSAGPVCQRLAVGPVGSGTSSPAAVFGLFGSGHSGKREAGDGEARRRRVGAGAELERTGDIAHLGVSDPLFAFYSPCQEISTVYSPCFRHVLSLS